VSSDSIVIYDVFPSPIKCLERIDNVAMPLGKETVDEIYGAIEEGRRSLKGSAIVFLHDWFGSDL
jgi:hypothetical protein